MPRVVASLSRTSILAPRTVMLAAIFALGGCGGGGGDGPAVQTYSLSATISGLNSSGLVLSVSGISVSVTDGTSTQLLAGSLASGTQYSVTVAVQPAGQTCSVASGSGTIGSANVANVVVTCSDQAYSLGGSITGLGSNAGLILANGGDRLAVPAGATTFTMPTPVAYTSSYQLTVQSQPSGLTCSVSNGAGTMPAAAVSSVQISCTDQPFSLGGGINGLGSSPGLVLVNTDDNDALSVNGGSTSFTMPTPVGFTNPYSISVQSSPAGLTCTASSAAGIMPAANVNNVLITCSNQAYSLSGTISGLISSGLKLANDGGTLTVSSGASGFSLPAPIAYGSPYDVTVEAQPSGLTCTVSNGVGTMPEANVTNVAVTCSVNTYTIGGMITGLTASGLVLLNNNGDATSISANATNFTMNTGAAYGSSYDVTVLTGPANLACTVTNGSGTVGAGDVTDIDIACASNFTLMYSFGGPPTDGAIPVAGLIQGSNGNLYGTTEQGGNSSAGTVFEFEPTSGTETVLHSFAGSGGISLRASVIQGGDGGLYGTTFNGGAYGYPGDPSGYGTVFEVSPSSGMETVLHSFGAPYSSDGGNPLAALILGSDGNFYGTTYGWGAYAGGTVYRITTDGTETVLYSFGDVSGDGISPEAGLVQASDGSLYGTTAGGGANNYGTVFKVDPSTGTESVVYAFAGGTSDGASPQAALIQGADGYLYGTTAAGGTYGDGTVFRVSPSNGDETVLYSFGALSGDGTAPAASLMQDSDGNLYGTTPKGGAYGKGTVFVLSVSGGTESVLHSFAGGSNDGDTPSAELIQGSDGNLYGTTEIGGANNAGALFKVTLQ